MKSLAMVSVGVGAFMVSLAPLSHAANIGVVSKKLIVVDKITAAGKAKVAYVAKDAAITKGSGTDPSNIMASFSVTYDTVAGGFSVPAGAIDGGDTGWVANKDTVAKFVNKAVPAVTGTKVAVIKPGKLIKIIGKTLGDTPIDILGGGAPSGSVFTAYTVVNGAESNTHCTEFTECSHKPVGGGTGAKLVCKSPNLPDPLCTAAGGGGSPSRAFLIRSRSLID